MERLHGSGGAMVLKLFSFVCLLITVADYFDFLPRLEAPVRRLSERLWRVYPQYWHYIYRATPGEMGPVGRFFHELGQSVWKVVMIGMLLFGGVLVGTRSETFKPIAMLFLAGALVVFLSPLVVSAIAWLLKLLSLPRKGIVGTASLLLGIASFAIDMTK